MKNRPPKGILAELRGVYGKIITKLWSGKWATSSSLLKLTGQKYFDRRIRELRDEYGFDIESKNVFGEWSYRLVSKSRTSAKRMFPNGILTLTIFLTSELHQKDL
jgi:hypothetical protein